MNNHSINNLYYKILKSSLLLENPFYGNEEILNWVKERNEEVKVQVNQIEFNKLRNWSFSKEEGALKHSSNKFFSIKGLQVDIKYQNQRTTKLGTTYYQSTRNRLFRFYYKGNRRCTLFFGTS